MNADPRTLHDPDPVERLIDAGAQAAGYLLAFAQHSQTPQIAERARRCAQALLSAMVDADIERRLHQEQP